MFLKWIQSLFKKKGSTDTVDVHFRLPDGREFYIECYRIRQQIDHTGKTQDRYIQKSCG